MSRLAEAASRYGGRGVPIFPVKPRLKEPLVKGGFHAATTDEGILAGWWDRVPDANIGTSPGATSKVVIDIDPRNGGDESFAQLEQLYGKIETAEVHTGGGGTHYWLQLPEGVTIRSRSNAFGPDFPGVDVKSTGGYVVLPPSVHPCGAPYQWDAGNRAFADMPTSWLDALVAADDGGKSPAPQLGEAEEIPAGKRDSTLASLAGTMRRRGFSYDAIFAALVAENAQRCRPPMPDGDLQRIATSVSRYAPASPLSEPARAPPSPAATGVLRFDDLVKRSTESVDWFVEGLLRRSGILLLASQPKVGKSDTARNLARAVATGTEFLGRRCQKGSVLWIGLEEPLSHLRERIEIMGMQDHDIIYVIEQPVGDESAWLCSVVEAHNPDLVFIDTIGRFSRIENVNDYSQVGRATQPALDLRSRLGTTFAFLHHNNHMNKTLGSTMWEGVVDTIASLTRNPDGTRFIETKQRSGVDMAPTVLKMDRDTGSITCDVPAFIADQRIAEKRILDHLRTVESATREDLAKACGRRANAGRAAVDSLVTAGLIKCQGTGARGSPRLYSAIGTEGQLESLVLYNGLYTDEDSEESEHRDKEGDEAIPVHSEEPGFSEDSGDSEEIDGAGLGDLLGYAQERL